MTNEYRIKLSTISRNALDGHLLEAINDLIALSRAMDAWDVNNAAERLQDAYRAMLTFLAREGADTSNAEMTDTIISDVLALTMRLSRALNMELSPDEYFSTARTFNSHVGETIASLIDDYRVEIGRLDADFESITDPNRTQRAEQILRNIFNRIWITHPLSTDDFDNIGRLFYPAVPRHAALLAISAVGLGHMNYYDTNRLAWLLERYVEFAETEPQIALRALVEAMAGMIRYRRRPIAKKVKNLLAVASDMPTWPSDFTTVAIELMRALGTEAISQKMNSDIMSHINSIDPKIREKIETGQFDIDSLSVDFNPEWGDEISQSELGQSLRELSEIQQEGGDVFMATFSQMKRFPFFRDVANWFMPFHDNHSAVALADSDDGSMSGFLSIVPALCDSDKFSLILSLTNVAQAQKDLLINALRQHADQMLDSISETEKVSGKNVRRNIINKYIQNLYRFYRLFPHRDGFYNLFDEKNKPDLLQVKALEHTFDNFEILDAVVQFYLKNHYWDEAASLIELIDRLDPGNHEAKERRLQQLGYAYERGGKFDKARKAYDHAEMLNVDSEWTMRHLAKVLRHEGIYLRAGKIYARLSDKYPDDGQFALAAAQCLLAAGESAAAETLFYRANYLLADNLDALRGLAWSQFLNKKVSKAVDSFDKILGLSNNDDDLERMAFIKWAQGKIPEAITLFRIATHDNPALIDALNIRISDNIKALADNGANVMLQNTIIETLRLLASE